MRALKDSLETFANVRVELLIDAEGTGAERTNRIKARLKERRADLAVVDVPAIGDQLFFGYSLLPFLTKDLAAARQYDLDLRRPLNLRLGDESLVALGTLPRLPRVIVAPLPAWDGRLDGARVLATTRIEADAFARLIGSASEAAPAELPQKLVPGSFAVLPLPAAIALAQQVSSLYLYDVRTAFPALAVLAPAADANADQRAALADAVGIVEAAVWERLDQYADSVLLRARERLKLGELDKGFGARHSELVLRAIRQNAQRSVSEDVQRGTVNIQQRIAADGQGQVYGKLCRRLEILLVTNRALSAPPPPGAPLPQKGRELANDVGPASHYGVLEVQVPARDLDLQDAKAAVGECTDGGRISADKGARLQEVRLYPRKDFEPQARRAAGGYGKGAPFLVFVHGFNVNFADAVTTIARLSLRMEHRMVPVLVSWPSAGWITAYPWDGERAAKSTGVIGDALSALRAADAGRKIQLVAHSMGNRIVMAALAPVAGAPAPAAIDELVNVAPDVPCDGYAQAAAAILRGRAKPGDIVGRATLYLYEKDSALTASDFAHKFSPASEKCRAGNQKGAFAARIPGVQTVDWSCLRDPVDSHSYYLHSNYIAGDLQNIVFGHQQPLARKLNQIKAGAGFYYLHSGISDPKDCLPKP